MSSKYHRLCYTVPRCVRLADRMVDMQMTYRPGDMSSSWYDGPEIVGGVQLTLRIDGRLYDFGYGYVLTDGRVDVPTVSRSQYGELGDYDGLRAVLGGDYQDEIQGLVPTSVQPWRWRGSKLAAKVMPPIPNGGNKIARINNERINLKADLASPPEVHSSPSSSGFFTPVQRAALLANGQRSAGDSVTDTHPVVKLFVPGANAVWLLTELDPRQPNRAFGLCDLGLGSPELGSVTMSELYALRGPLGQSVEADQGFVADHPLSHYAVQAQVQGRIDV